MTDGPIGTAIWCRRHDAPVRVIVLLRGFNGLTNAMTWQPHPGFRANQKIIDGRGELTTGLTQAIVDTGKVRERLPLVCPACGNDVPARQEKLDAVLEKLLEHGAPEPDLDLLRLILSKV